MSSIETPGKPERHVKNERRGPVENDRRVRTTAARIERGQISRASDRNDTSIAFVVRRRKDACGRPDAARECSVCRTSPSVGASSLAGRCAHSVAADRLVKRVELIANDDG